MAPTYSNGQEIVSIYLIKIKITTKFFKSVCMGNIQNIQTIIRPYKTNIKMGKDLNVHTNVQGHFGMVKQYQKHANHFYKMCMYNHLTASRINTLAGS